MALRWFLLLSLCMSVAGCAGDTDGKTEVLVSIDALGAARDSTSVRIEVNAAVVELEAPAHWPLEVLVTAQDADVKKTFKMRAFGLMGAMVMGGAKADGTFKKGKRTGLMVQLDPSADVGALPAVNAQVGPGKIVVQPNEPPDMDAGDGEGADGGLLDGSFESGAAADAGAIDDGGTCDASAACDAGGPEKDACVPSPADCEGCGMSCAADRQCVAEQCLPIPNASCKPPFQVQGHLYQYCQDLRNWESARVACQARGYDLVIFDSASEYAAVTMALVGVATNDYWLGGHDRGDNGSGAASCTRSKAEGIWRWVDPVSGSEEGAEFCRFSSSSAESCTSTTGAFFSWASGQPDNDGCSCGLLNLGACNNAEDCLAMSANGWNDTECTDARHYLCEAF